MLALIIIIIAIGILGLGFVLYKVLLEETKNIEEDKKKEKEEQLKKKKESYFGQIEEKGIDAFILSIKDNPIEFEKFKAEVQKELRIASKNGNTNKVRECNDILKKIDENH